jgi:hypothetical protein
LVDNPDLGHQGAAIVGHYISELPWEAVQLVEPIISMNNTRTMFVGGNTGATGAIYWMLDEYLGFGSMRGYLGSGANAVREGANVILLQNSTGSDAIAEYVKENKAGLINVMTAGHMTDERYGTGTTPATFMVGQGGGGRKRRRCV